MEQSMSLREWLALQDRNRPKPTPEEAIRVVRTDMWARRGEGKVTQERYRELSISLRRLMSRIKKQADG